MPEILDMIEELHETTRENGISLFIMLIDDDGPTWSASISSGRRGKDGEILGYFIGCFNEKYYNETEEE